MLNCNDDELYSFSLILFLIKHFLQKSGHIDLADRIANEVKNKQENNLNIFICMLFLLGKHSIAWKYSEYYSDWIDGLDEMILSYNLLLTGSIIAGQASAWYAWPHLQV